MRFIPDSSLSYLLATYIRHNVSNVWDDAQVICNLSYAFIKC